MDIVCLDLEGVLVPEIWVAFAQQTGVSAFLATTRDIADYDELMAMRLAELTKAGMGLSEIQETIQQLTPLPGARVFLDRLRAQYQVVILSDTFYEFAVPLMQQLGMPMLLCHHLTVDSEGHVCGYQLRQPEAKRAAVQAFKSLRMRTLAMGDSYNDLGMLNEADFGILFNPPESLTQQKLHACVYSYDDALAAFSAAFTDKG